MLRSSFSSASFSKLPAGDVFSFGYLVTRLFKDAKLEIPPVLREVAKKCQRSIPEKRPKMMLLCARLTVFRNKLSGVSQPFVIRQLE